MSTAEALAYLAAGTRTGKLATASPTGAVHVAPVWFLVAAQARPRPELVFTTWHETVKARHLAANPRAALTVDSETFPFAFVIVRGRVRVEREPADLAEWTHRLAARYVPAERVAEYGARNAVPGEWLCRLSVDRLIGQVDIAG